MPLIFFVCGCWGSDPTPHVSYDPPKLEGPFDAVAVADAREDAPEPERAKVSLPPRIRHEVPLAFEGRFKAANPEVADGVVHVRFHRRDAERTIVADEMGQITRDPDGWLCYRVEMKAPERRADCDVEVIYMGHTLAVGAVQVE
jgi:hypothetical protein